jgi:hypothetical protein
MPPIQVRGSYRYWYITVVKFRGRADRREKGGDYEGDSRLGRRARLPDDVMTLTTR